MATSTFYAADVNADLQQQLSQTPPPPPPPAAPVNGQAAKDPAVHQRTYQAWYAFHAVEACVLLGG